MEKNPLMNLEIIAEVANSHQGKIELVKKIIKEFYYQGEEKVEKAIDLYNKFFIEGNDLDNYCLTGEL